VIAKSKVHKIKIIEKKVVEVAKTFQDSMDMAKSNDERKEIILDLFKNNISKLNDIQYKFKPGDVKYFCQTDSDFLIKLFKLISQNPLIEAPFIKTFGFIKAETLLKLENKEHRSFLIEIIKSYLFDKSNRSNKLLWYIFRPVNSQLLTYYSQEQFDVDYCHKEYFPIVNQRVFSVG
jgi:Fe-S cluster biosynthesis and repair protein YggX